MSKWIPAWRYVPIDYNQDVAIFENITQKCLFTNNLGGTALRLRLSNPYSDTPFTVTHIAVTLRNRVTGVSSPAYPVTLDGSEEITVPAKEEIYADPIACPVSWEDDILVSMYFQDKTVFRSVCTTATGYGWQASHHTGNFHETNALGYTIKSLITPVLAREPHPLQFAAGISEVAVLNDDGAQLIGLFGDSITHMSFVSDPFQRMLYERFPGKYSVINGGIAGNRIQKSFPVLPDFPGGGHQFGIAGKDRFLTDMYNGAAPDIVFIMEGVNDCSHSIVFGEQTVPTSREIYDALCDVAAQAKAQGSRVYITTITPFGAFGEPWRPQAEDLRQGYNALIREGKVGDDWIDLDAIMRSPADIHVMQDGMHLGDGVHPNWHGGSKMAKAVLDKWFPAE